MSAITLILWVVVAVFAGALMRAMFGFGEAIVSMPLLALLPIPLQTSVSLIGLAGLTVAILTLIGGGRQIDRPVLIRLAITTSIGVPVGLVVLNTVPSTIITSGLGIFLIAYGFYCIAKKRLYRAMEHPLLNDRGWALPFGFASGVLGSAYNMNGVPVVVFGTLRGWAPGRLRGTLQAHFVISGAFVVVGHALGGLWSNESFSYFAYSLPAILGATVLGTYINKRIPTPKFELYLFLIIVALGILLLIPRGTH